MSQRAVKIDCCFFFKAEAGIRDWSVTGVQTCALPISTDLPWGRASAVRARARAAPRRPAGRRSEERRVGKEGRSRGAPYHLKKKEKESLFRGVGEGLGLEQVRTYVIMCGS